jgi:hypothetical protein
MLRVTSLASDGDPDQNGTPDQNGAPDGEGGPIDPDKRPPPPPTGNGG